MGSPTLFGGTVNGDASYLGDISGPQKRNFVYLTSDSNNSIVRFSTGDKQVQFFAFNNYLPLWAWTKEFTNG